MLRSSSKNEKLSKQIFPQQPSAGESKNELFGIDTFFVYRAAAYIAVGATVILLSLLWGASDSGSLLAAAIIIFCLNVCFGGRLLYIGRERKYFVLELTCNEVYFHKGYETIGSFLNPASQTAFRKSQRVTFTDENDNKIAFTFEKGRRFLQYRKYAFYFRELPPGEDATVEVLERLKIDHRIIPQPVSV